MIRPWRAGSARALPAGSIEGHFWRRRQSRSRGPWLPAHLAASRAVAGTAGVIVHEIVVGGASRRRACVLLLWPCLEPGCFRSGSLDSHGSLCSPPTSIQVKSKHVCVAFVQQRICNRLVSVDALTTEGARAHTFTVGPPPLAVLVPRVYEDWGPAERSHMACRSHGQKKQARADGTDRLCWHLHEQD